MEQKEGSTSLFYNISKEFDPEDRKNYYDDVNHYRDDDIIRMKQVGKRDPQNQRHRIFQCFSIVIYLITWVTNSEIIQGISNGFLLENNKDGGYDKPATITWLGYNYMILGLPLFVLPYNIITRKKNRRKNNTTSISSIFRTWSGKLGLLRSVLSCLALVYMLQTLNILFILGLECISVSLSNAVFQLQTVFTVTLSVYFLNDKFVLAEAIGILISIIGIAMIVLPPILLTNDTNSNNDTANIIADNGSSSSPLAVLTSTCISKSSPLITGLVATLGSAAIGGTYLVAWRLLEEKRRNPNDNDNINNTNRLEGFIDAQMTLSMVGICNLLFGWPILFVSQWIGLETIEFPASYSIWRILNINGIFEYAFDASSAVAIYMTSPVIVAIVSPLTIPLSLVTDRVIYNNDTQQQQQINGWMTWIGVLVILVGVTVMETKPDFIAYYYKLMHKRRQHDDEKYLGKKYYSTEEDALLS